MAYSVNATATARLSQMQNDTMEQLPKGKEAGEEDGGKMTYCGQCAAINTAAGRSDGVALR
jgi:hypothetical protein